jgi:hypothetical protein
MCCMIFFIFFSQCCACHLLSIPPGDGWRLLSHCLHRVWLSRDFIQRQRPPAAAVLAGTAFSQSQPSLPALPRLSLPTPFAPVPTHCSNWLSHLTLSASSPSRLSGEFTQRRQPPSAATPGSCLPSHPPLRLPATSADPFAQALLYLGDRQRQSGQMFAGTVSIALPSPTFCCIALPPAPQF